MAANFKIFRDFEPEGKPALAAAAAAAVTTTTTTATGSTVGQPTTIQQQQQPSQHQPPPPSSQQHDDLATAKQLQQQQLLPLQPSQQFGGKREPLGLRQYQQPPPQQPPQTNSQQSSQQALHDSSGSSSLAGGTTSEEDQENDISMASLGSDFVPSIIQDEANFVEYNSFEIDEEEGAISQTTDEDYLHFDDGDINDLIATEDLLLADDEDDQFDDNDLELRKELSAAFKANDDSQLFKSTIYINDIETYLASQEKELDLRALPNYMAYHREIDSDKRAILINWLVEVSDEYNMETETLFICANIIDRFLSHMSISTRNFQLLGIAAMFIASKYEEIYPPQLHQFVEVTDDTYSGRQICQMEQEILKTLNFRITFPTVTLFLRRIFAFNKFPEKVFHMAEYLCYLSLTAEQPFLEYYPSEIALAAVILAANQLGSASKISPELKRAYDESNQAQLDRRQLPKGARLRDIDRRAYIVDKDLPFCIESLRSMQECSYSASKTDSAIYHRFSKDSHGRVAQLSPPRVEELLNY